VICAAVAFAFGIRTETPVGSLKGTAIAQESGVPLAADVSLEPTRPWAPENWSFYDTTAGEDGTFVLRNVPTGTYWLRMRSKAHTFRETKINIVEGQTQVIEAELEPNEPYLSLYVHEYVFMPGESPQIVCEGFVDASAIDVKLYKVDLDKFLLGSSHGSLPQFLGSRSGYMDYAHESRLDLSANKSLQPAGAVSTPITKRDAEGVFTQRVTMPALGPGLYVVAVKSAGIQKLDWLMVTSLGMIAKTAGGKTLIYSVDLKTGSPVPSAKVGIYIGSTPVASAVTGPDGLATTSVPVGTDSQSSQVIIGRSGESLAFITAELNSTTTSNKEVYSYTDRPVYRPGQTVYYKGIVRNRTDDTYRTPSPEPVTVEVTDPNETLIYRGTKRTDRFGSYFGSLHLDSEAPTGYYSVRTSVGGKELGEEKGTGFSVSAYRKPEFSVKISFDKRRYTRGDWVTAKVSVNYYFGSPVANAHLYYSVQRSPYWLFENEGYYEGEGYSDYGGYGEWVQDGELWTDANGEANISFPATWSQPTSRDTYDTDQEFQVSVDASDKAGAQATGEGSVIATRGEFAIDVKPDARITKPGATVEVKLTAKDYDRHPVKNKSITVVLARETWSEEDEESVTHDLVTREVTTDDAGRASVRLPIKNSGSLLVTARSRDSRGNTIVSTEYLWSCGDGERCDFGPVSDVQVVADKRQYSPGETAKVLVLTNKPGGTALVTLEGSRVYAAKTVPLRGKSSTVQFNVAKDYGPNFYIAVSYLHDKQVMSHETRARVSMGSEALRVKIEPSAKRYKPGQKASYAVKVTDSKGRPVSAQLSMGVVDEAIYAIQEDNTTPILDYFYSHRDNQVETYDSIPRIYLSDPDKAGAPLKDQPVKIRVRKRFLDTAYWNPAIVTNSDGEARVSFDLPDNLTTWRATVRGITEGTMCGQATNTVISRQDMLVRLEMPRFLVQRDRTMLTAVVHNYTSKDQRVKVRLRAPGLHIDGDANRTISVARNGAERLDWGVSALKPGIFGVDVRAVGETAGDEVLLDLPVRPHGPQIVAAQSAVVAKSGESSVTVNVRRDAIMDATRLRITLAPSLAAAMFGSLDYLAQYPYGCTEQTVSSFLPDVVLFRSLAAAGMPKIERQAELPAMVRRGLGRLYKFELDDGGWSWCTYGEADPWMTAYVCYALIEARKAGFAVNDDVLRRGLDALNRMVKTKKMVTYSRAFGAYVLALGGRDSSAVMDRLAAYRKLPNESVAALALGYDAVGERDRAKQMLERLFAHSISDGNMTYWQGAWYGDGADVEPAALALQAVLKISPSDQRAYEIVRWLMSQWRDEYWTSTRATAVALYAMSEFLRVSKELSPNFTAVVILNGQQVSGARFDKSSIYRPQVQITIPGRDLKKGRNEIKIVKVGAGNLYYSTNLTQSVDQEFMPAVLSSAGLTVTRDYFRPSPVYFQSGASAALGSPVRGCSVGDTVLVRLTIHSESLISHAMLEDYIPAGCEIITQGAVELYAWDHWWVGQDVRDDKIAFYLNEIAPGKHTVEYQIRGGFCGSYCALPAQVFSMYDPSVRATTESSEFRVRQ